jgi:uncharacterized membrane protein YqaE (UPF0057 family)
MALTCGDIPRLICSILLPPLGVFFQVGCNKDFAINCLLTLLGCVLVACVPKDLLDVHAFV